MTVRWTRGTAILAAAVALSIGVAACGSSGGGGAGGTSGTSGTSGAAASSGSGSTSSGGGSATTSAAGSPSGSGTAKAPTGTPILIGVPAPLSGSEASAGQDIVDAAKLAAADINAKGGVLGRPVQVVSQDDACSAQTAAQAASKLISQGVVAAAGGYCSTAAFPELQAFHNAKIPFVMCASTNPKLTEQGFAEAFRTIFRDDEQGPVAADFITKVLKAKKVAVVNDNTTYAKGLADSTVAALQKDGAQVVYNNALTPGQSDYTSILTKVNQTNPDVFYYTGYYPEFGLLLKQAKQLGVKYQMMGGDANNDPTLIKTAGAAATGALVDTAPLAQFISSASGYVDQYTKKYGTGPGPYGTYDYDAVGVLAAAIAKANSTDPSKITDALHNLGSYQGVTGTFHFDKNGDRQPVDYIVITVKDGKFVPAYEKNDSTGQWEKAGS